MRCFLLAKLRKPTAFIFNYFFHILIFGIGRLVNHVIMSGLTCRLRQVPMFGYSANADSARTVHFPD